MDDSTSNVYFPGQADLSVLDNCTLAVIGYGNQGRAQALNLRDHNLKVTIGNVDDPYKELALKDGFEALTIPEAAARGDIILLLLPDELLPGLFQEQIAPSLRPGATMCFASGYTVAFDLIEIPPTHDMLLIAPRMIGVGVRERFLTGEGFYCFVGIHRDASGQAQARLLALTEGIGGLLKPAIQVTFKQEAVLDLFNEQAFGPAFGRVLLSSISVLIENGISPEAALVEMYLSEEMAYTYRQMALSGLVRQTLFHSHTSQYGAMSRALRFMKLDFKTPMRKIYREIENGDFAREWQKPRSRLLFKVIRYFAMRQPINRLEISTRQALGLPEQAKPFEMDDGEVARLMDDPTIQAELESFRNAPEF